MPRVVKKSKKKPLRASVRQNTAPTRPAKEETRPWFGFGARLALLILITTTIIGVTAWLWHSEWTHRQAQNAVQATLNLTKQAGFSVSDVVVEGRYYTDKTDLLTALGVKAGAPIFTFDPQESHEKIMALPWTDSVSILRSLPNKIVIKLTERQPMARWQYSNKTIVIDREGRELTAAQAEHFPALPLVIGTAAAEQTKALLRELQGFPVVTQVLKSAVRVSRRRWNFYIQPNLLIRLPEKDLPSALAKLTRLIQDQKITERDIISVDLRLADRMIIEPGTPSSAPQDGETNE